jgi:PAS domain S-box-containing protein
MGQECEGVPEALRTAHTRIITSATAECAGNAIVGHTVDSRIVYWNRGAERIYGYAPDEAMGQPGSILALPGQNELPGVIERIRRGAHVERYETRRLAKDGAVITVSAVVSPIRTRDGEIIGVSVDSRDLSERKRTEEALLRLAAVVDSSEDAIIWNAPDTTILAWNRGAERIYGYAAAEVIGQPFSILLPAGSEDEMSSISARIRHGEQAEHCETKHQRKDGVIIEVSLTVALVKAPGGEILGVSALARDLTERKQVEAARMKMARLHQVQAARRPLLERVFASQEQERRRIARELHDQAGQLMTSLLVGLRALDDSATVDEMKAQVQCLRVITAQAIDEVGRLARGLHSSLPDDHGLGIALQRYAADYSRTHHIAVDLTLNESDLADLLPDVQLAVFRIVQEALTNVARHSAATAIRIRVTRSGTRLETTIADNGGGFEADAKEVDPEAHLGIQSMRERAAILGGTVRLTSGSTGTTVLVQLPTEKRDPKAS